MSDHTNPKRQPTTLRGLARRLQVSASAIVKGYHAGRLPRSVAVRHGRPVVVDLPLALREWRDNASRVKRPRAAAPATRGTISLIESQQRLAEQRSRKLELENDLNEGRSLDRNTAAREAFEAARIIRENFQNMPAQLSAEFAAETDARKIFQRLDEAIRQALTAAADQLIKTVNE